MAFFFFSLSGLKKNNDWECETKHIILYKSCFKDCVRLLMLKIIEIANNYNEKQLQRNGKWPILIKCEIKKTEMVFSCKTCSNNHCFIYNLE